MSKSTDSGHFWADPGKICFLDPKTRFWPPSQNWQNLCQNLSILDTFGPILGKSAFCTQKLDFGHPPKISKICIKIYRFWTLLGRSWENHLFFCTPKPYFGHPPRVGKICVKICRFWTLLGRSCENLPFKSQKLDFGHPPRTA